MSQVLIIDDHLANLKVIEQLIQQIDHTLEIHCFTDPTLGLEWIDHNHPELILCNYAIDGVALLSEFRTLQHCHDVPIIVMTDSHARSVRYQALEEGATDVLTLPIDQYECQIRCSNLLTMCRQHRGIKLRATQLEQEITVAVQQVQDREQETLLRLAKAGEFRDEDTGLHVVRVAAYSRLIAEKLGLSHRHCEMIEKAAPMHDIGKVGINDHILLKDSSYTMSERALMQTHTTIGYNILKGSPSRYLRAGAVIARSHHERFDGRGYPFGLKSNEIPLMARIVAIADVFDALTTQRPYKRPWSRAAAFEHLHRERGHHFDPECVDTFLAHESTIIQIQQPSQPKLTVSPHQ